MVSWLVMKAIHFLQRNGYDVPEKGVISGLHRELNENEKELERFHNRLMEKEAQLDQTLGEARKWQEQYLTKCGELGAVKESLQERIGQLEKVADSLSWRALGRPMFGKAEQPAEPEPAGGSTIGRGFTLPSQRRKEMIKDIFNAAELNIARATEPADTARAS